MFAKSLYQSTSSRIRALIAVTLVLTFILAAVPSNVHAQQTRPENVIEIMRFDLNSFWYETFRLDGAASKYNSPKRIVWYNTARRPGPIKSPCGQLDVNNSFYCSRDQMIYLDYTFHWNILQNKGDYAVGFVFAHEWAHHIQHLLGIMSKVTSKQLELQADCLTGVYSQSADGRGLLEAGDLEEAYSTVIEIGDIPGTSPDDPKAHGTAEERLSWFLYGYETGDASKCRTY